MQLIWCVNEISNCVQIYVTICLIIKVVCNFTPGQIRRFLGQLSNMGV